MKQSKGILILIVVAVAAAIALFVSDACAQCGGSRCGSSRVIQSEQLFSSRVIDQQNAQIAQLQAQISQLTAALQQLQAQPAATQTAANTDGGGRVVSIQPVQARPAVPIVQTFEPIQSRPVAGRAIQW